jgi:Fungal specific transcription factor domain
MQSDDEGAVDAQATAAFNDEPDTNTGYFGPSSNHALFRSLSNAFAQFISTTLPLRARLPPASTITLRRSPSRAATRSKAGIFGQERPHASTLLALPSDREASTMVDQFFSTVATVLPIVSKADVVSECNRLRRPDSPALKPSSRALLNIIFAHVSKSSKDSEAEIFYRRALASLDQGTLRGATIELLQALLLIAIFQQNNQRSIASWTFHALAVKTAYQLGLQSESAYKEYGLQESQLRRRLWYAVIHQDRILSLLLGRPCLVPQSHIRTEKPITSQLLYQNMPTIIAERTDGLIYYSRVIDLWDILGDALHQLYEDNVEPDSSLSAQEIVTRRLKLQWKLDNWRQDTIRIHGLISEPELDHISSSSYDSIRFRIMLSLQYCYAIMLIDRPILCKLLATHAQNHNVEQDVESVLGYAVIVVENDYQAIKDLLHIINAICTCDEPFVDRNGAWWLCNYTSKCLLTRFASSQLVQLSPSLSRSKC